MSDPFWLADKVPSLFTQTVYLKTSKARGRGDWRGVITVVTNFGNLNTIVLHTIE